MSNENARLMPMSSNEKWDLFCEVLEERRHKEADMNFRHPWVNLFYNYLVATVAFFLCVALFWWGVDVYIRHSADEQTAVALAAYQYEQEAHEAAVERSEEAIRDGMARSLARLFFGADKFKTKYNYSENDFLTLARCVFNRVENKAYPNSIFDVINQASQWVGYCEDNPVLDSYYQIALKAISEWQCETIKPISNDFLWAEFTPQGIYLKNDFQADAYATRWRVS